MTISLGKAAPVSRAELRLNERMQEYNRRTQKKNAKFAKLDAAAKRVAIAKDVLKWLDGRKLVAHSGAYLGIGPAGYLKDRKTWTDLDAVAGRLVIDTETVNGHQCVACAVGGLFAVAVENGECGGSVRPAIPEQQNGRISGNVMREKLGAFFDLDQLILIEAAFERGSHVFPDDMTQSEAWTKVGGEPGYHTAPYGSLLKQAVQFGLLSVESIGDSHLKDEAAMRAVMKNIIANKGTFVP